MRSSRVGPGAVLIVAAVTVCVLTAAGTVLAQAAARGTGQPCGINLASLSKSSGYPGDKFEMIGTWGATQGSKVPFFNKGGFHPLEIVTWTAIKLTAKVPMDVAPGGPYMVGVYCESLEGGGTVYGSGTKPFEVLKPVPLPDITAGLVDPKTQTKPGIVFGGAIGGAGGKFVPWGGVANLTEADSFMQSNGQCAFNVTYAMTNLGPVATSPAFLNRLRSDGNVVAINSALSLAANEKNHSITTQPYLTPGGHGLKLSLDDDHNVTESNEGNNTFSVRYVLQGKCAGAPAARQR